MSRLSFREQLRRGTLAEAAELLIRSGIEENTRTSEHRLITEWRRWFDGVKDQETAAIYMITMRVRDGKAGTTVRGTVRALENALWRAGGRGGVWPCVRSSDASEQSHANNRCSPSTRSERGCATSSGRRCGRRV